MNRKQKHNYNKIILHPESKNSFYVINTADENGSALLNEALR